MPHSILSRPMRRGSQIALFTVIFALCIRTGAANALPPTPSLTLQAEQVGMASWYGQREAGHRTASGVVFNPALKTAAHRTFPLGSCVQITHLDNRRTLVVPVIDRGPNVAGRVIDLSQAAARALGMERAGLARVRLSATACLRAAQLRVGAKDPFLARTSIAKHGERS
jgi:rare lipoprotein A